MARLSIQDNRITIKEGFSKTTVMAMDNLRLVYLFLPESLQSFFVVASSSGIEGYNLDNVADENIQDLSQKFDDMIRQERAGKLYGLKLIMADYENRSVTVPLKDIKKSNIDIFATLLRFRKQRLDKLRVWLANHPEVQLKGLMGQQAGLSHTGFRRGKKNLAWDEVGNLEINTVNMSTHFLVIPKGVSTGFFSFKKQKYSMLISIKKKELCIAECDFWMAQVNDNNADTPADSITQKLEELAELKEQGIITDENFQAAKQQLLEQI